MVGGYACRDLVRDEFCKGGSTSKDANFVVGLVEIVEGGLESSCQSSLEKMEPMRMDGAADVVAASYYVIPAWHRVSSVLRALATASIRPRWPHYCYWYARSIREYEFDILKFPSPSPVLSK